MRDQIVPKRDLAVEVTIVGEGSSVLEKLCLSGIDLVLMDVQMPGMDGFEATRLIRAEQGFADLPVVAMTAHTMEGDKARCLAAGMNDYLAKPVDPVKLHEVMEKWLEKGWRRSPEENGYDEAVITDALKEVDLVAGLKRIGGNHRLFIKLVREFYLHHHDSCERVERALKAESWQEVEILTHTLQGVAGSLGCRQLEVAARELHVSVKHREVQVSRQQLKTFCAASKMTFEQLAYLLNLWRAEGKRPGIGLSAKRNIILFLIQELFNLLRERNPDAGEWLDALRDGLDLGELNINQLIIKLKSQVVDFDYSAAMLTLQQLTDTYMNRYKSASHG